MNQTFKPGGSVNSSTTTQQSSGVTTTNSTDGGVALNQVLNAGGYPAIGNTTHQVLTGNTTQGNTINSDNTTVTTTGNSILEGKDATGIFICVGVGIALLVIIVISSLK